MFERKDWNFGLCGVACSRAALVSLSGLSSGEDVVAFLAWLPRPLNVTRRVNKFLKILEILKIKGPRKACFLEFLGFSAFFKILKIPKILKKHAFLGPFFFF